MKIGEQYKKTLEIFKKFKELKKLDSELSDKDLLVQSIRDVKSSGSED